MTCGENHVHKRHAGVGRWFPLFLYLVNYGLWFISGIMANAPDLLWLAVFPAAAPILYIFRTQRLSG